MVIQADLQYLNGVDVYGIDGGKIGSAGQVYLDDRTGEPEWIGVRTDVFGVFTSSTSTLQYVLADLECDFFRTAVSENLAGARKLMMAQTEMLAKEERRIAGQDLLDSIEDRTDDEDLGKRIDQIDRTQRVIAKVVDGLAWACATRSTGTNADGADPVAALAVAVKRVSASASSASLR